MANLFIGTCSWKYDSWKGIIYPDTAQINYLEEYSKHYNTVEVDQWFWSLHSPGKITLPKRNIVMAYNKSVPNDFKFSIKVPNSISLTHFYQKMKSDPLIPNDKFLDPELFEQFLLSIDDIKSKLGPLMFQFEYLNKEKIPAQNIFVLKLSNFIQNIPNKYPLAMETRNPNYLNNAYFDFLEQNQLSHVFLQGYYMPPIFEVYKNFKDRFVSPVVIRLHGPDRKGIEKKAKGQWNKVIEPKDEELKKIVDMIIELLSKKIDIYLNVNNHYEGSAPLTIKKIKGLLAK